MTRLLAACFLLIAIGSCVLRDTLAVEHEVRYPQPERATWNMDLCAKLITHGKTVVCISRQQLERMQREAKK